MHKANHELTDPRAKHRGHDPGEDEETEYDDDDFGTDEDELPSWVTHPMDDEGDTGDNGDDEASQPGDDCDDVPPDEDGEWQHLNQRARAFRSTSPFRSGPGE